MSESMLRLLDENIDESRKYLELGNALSRLKSSADFKKIILDGFLEKEAIRLVRLKGAAESQDPDTQEYLVKQIDAIGILCDYFERIENNASIAKKMIGIDEETRDELTKEIFNVR